MALNAARPLRADAARNRRRILDAAAGLFADRGLDVSIEDVASAAGVGVGTVYRRFADREELIEALFEEKAATIIEMARDALEIEDPWEAFASFFRAACHMQATDQGLREALLSADRGREHIARARAAIRPIAGELVARAQAAGELRPRRRCPRRADAALHRRPRRRLVPCGRPRLLRARADDHARRPARTPRRFDADAGAAPGARPVRAGAGAPRHGLPR